MYAEGVHGRSGEQSYFVVRDERINKEETIRAGKVNLAFGFAAFKPANTTPSSSRISRAVRARGDQRGTGLQLSPSVDLEIESSILRGLVPLAPPAPLAALVAAVRLPT